MTNKDLTLLQLENPRRFSKMLALISADDPKNYDKLIISFTEYNNLAGIAKGNYGKLKLDVNQDLLDAIAEFVRAPDVQEE